MKSQSRGQLRPGATRPSSRRANESRVRLVVDPSPERRIVDFRKLGFRDVLLLGRYHYNEVHRPLKPHSHGNAIEICLLDRGCQTYVVEGETYSLKGGDVLFTRPHEVHSTGGNPEDRGILYWMLVRVVGKSERFLSLPRSKHQPLLRELIDLPRRSFSSQGRLKPQLDRILSVCERENDPLRFAKLTGAFLHLLLEVIDLGRQAQTGQASDTIHRTQKYVRHHLEESLSVAQLAEVARLSPARFRSRFRKETGLTPGEFVIREKIEEAKKRLSLPDQTVTAVAMDLGFSTSQYFATVFRHYAGVSPSRFRQRLRLE